MSDTTQSPNPLAIKFDKAWGGILLVPVLVFILDRAQVLPTLEFTAGAFVSTAPFIIFAVLAVGFLKATGAEALLANAFEGREIRMIFAAALLGGLSPFCSCEVIPFIAAMLAVGAPLSAVMAFWLASPLMDPAMFLITSSQLGWEFAVAKAFAAIGLGIAGGFTVKAFSHSAVFADPLRNEAKPSGCGCGPDPFKQKPVWKFWNHAPRRQTFGRTVAENALFLGKWLLLAYMVESLMLTYVPAETIGSLLGGQGLGPIALGALIGAPAYMNGYMAVPLVAGLVEQGMSNGAAMAFIVAGGVSCIPAAMAVWALVKPRVFAAYIGIAITGAFFAGILWNLVA